VNNFALHARAMHWLTISLLFAVLVMGGTISLATEQVTLTVYPNARQTFGGLGVSDMNYFMSYGKLSSTQQQALARALYHDLHLKVLRLWLADNPSSDVMYQDFVRHFVDSHLLKNARQNGVTELLLAPSGDPTTRAYAARYAEVMRRLRDEKGVRITTTGIANEPNLTAQQSAYAVKFFREELDKRGLTRVKIVATEHSNCDWKALEEINGIKHDPLAWKALAGISTHSYNNAATNAMVAVIAGSGKQYWITEAGDNGPEDLHDTNRAITMSARFLNDMNHLVTHWVWFLGAEDFDAHDNSTRLIQYYPTKSPDAPWFERLRKYFFLQQLSRTFDVGAAFRYTACDRALPTKDLGWTYGQKPALNVAMAKNPDGTWAIGLSNDTDLDTAMGTSEAWKLGTRYYPRASYQVTLHVQELKKVRNLDFQVVCSNETLTQSPQGIVHMHYGTLTLTLNPRDLITLRSIK
jgi:hypothetical protein